MEVYDNLKQDIREIEDNTKSIQRLTEALVQAASGSMEKGKTTPPPLPSPKSQPRLRPCPTKKTSPANILFFSFLPPHTHTTNTKTHRNNE